MSSANLQKKPWSWVALGFVVALVLAAMGIPNLLRSRMAADESSAAARVHVLQTDSAGDWHYAPTAAKPASWAAGSDKTGRDGIKTAPAQGDPGVAGERKIVRTSALEMVVQHPADVAESIAAVAQRLGGYLVNAEGGGQNAAVGSLTICVPSARFEEARADIRKLGLRVESEKVEAQDVTRQYVDEDASLRNLRAEEAQYLTILKQASPAPHDFPTESASRHSPRSAPLPAR